MHFIDGDGRLEEWARRAERRASWRSALTVFVAVDDRIIAVLLFADELRRETPRAVRALRRAGVAKIVMVTGDRAESAETMGAALDLDAVLADRIPSDKVEAVVEERRLASTLMVGDGVNDAPALAAADVGLAMGARGASASSEAADGVVLVDRLDRVAEVVAIARRTRTIAMQSVIAGMTLSGVTMIAAAFGYVTPVAGALVQEAIDVAAILNALRALAPPGVFDRPPMSEAAATILREDHEKIETSLERLRQLSDALDYANITEARGHIHEADRIVNAIIVNHERADEETVYPRVSSYLRDSHGLTAMSRAHREILHQARLLHRLADRLQQSELEPYVTRDAQRIIESIEFLVQIHNAQEEDIYEHAATQLSPEASTSPESVTQIRKSASATPFEQALESAIPGKRRWRVAAGAVAAFAFIASALYWGGDYYAPRRTPPMHERAWSKFMAAHVLDDSVAVGVRVDGVINKVSCEIGEIVKVDQVCATIDARPFQLLAERANANLAAANGRLEKARKQFAQARASYERYQDRPTRATGIERTRKVFDRRQKELVQAEAAADLARVALRAAENDLQHTAILSPIDGTIVVRSVEVGQTVAAEQSEPLFRVAANPRVVKINLTLDARGANKLYVGESVLLSLELEQDRVFLGEVTQISSPKAAMSPENYDIIITIRDPSVQLTRGMSAMIRIEPAASRPERS